ncbi:MAG TPA: cell division topological specificity factor MinE [Clostridia bacterium]|jgi:cell division topological specificity factor|nr:cell division topological specificity factor MinE [Clostridia bacterium]
MIDFIARFFKKDKQSKDLAKERLQLVLIHDRINLPPYLLEQMKEELIGVIKRFTEIDEEALDIGIESSDRTVTLVANIPLKGEKKV